MAARLAAKEAVLKALGSALAGEGLEAPAGWRYRDIEGNGYGFFSELEYRHRCQRR